MGKRKVKKQTTKLARRDEEEDDQIQVECLTRKEVDASSAGNLSGDESPAGQDISDELSEDEELDEETKAAIDKEVNEKFQREDALGPLTSKKKGPTPGVIYISRPPKFMKPAKVRHLLGQYGTITNLFLQPEDKSAHRRRVKGGGNKKIVYTEGWVEFKRKRVAKQVALTLNGQRLGGNSRNFFADDVWNIKYLSGFKWSNLTEKVVYERKLREQRLKLELSKTKKENEFFLETVDKARELEKIEERKRKAGTFVAKKPNARSFRQITPVGSASSSATTGKKLKTEFLKGVLGQDQNRTKKMRSS